MTPQAQTIIRKGLLERLAVEVKYLSNDALDHYADHMINVDDYAILDYDQRLAMELVDDLECGQLSYLSEHEQERYCNTDRYQCKRDS